MNAEQLEHVIAQIRWAVHSLGYLREHLRSSQYVDELNRNLHLLQQTEARLSEARAQQQAASVPEGWQLVPKEPTMAMLREMVCQWDSIGHRNVGTNYAAMLAAAPNPPLPRDLAAKTDSRTPSVTAAHPTPTVPADVMADAGALKALSDLVEDLEMRANLKEQEERGVVDCSHWVYTQAIRTLAAARAAEKGTTNV